jgi:hypothetical protein
MLFGHVGIGICLAITVLASGRLFTAMLVSTGAFLGISVCNSWAISQMLAGPRMVGRWIGVQNFVGNLGGAVAPVLTGFILGKTGSFYWPFFITAVGLDWRPSWWSVVGPLEEINWDKEPGPRFRINATPAAGAAHP